MDFLHSPLFGGGLMLMITGGIIAYLRNIPSKAFGWLRRRFIIEVEVLGNDAVFQWMQLWLARHPYAKRARYLIASSGKNLGGIELKSSDEPSKREVPSVIFTPAP